MPASTCIEANTCQRWSQDRNTIMLRSIEGLWDWLGSLDAVNYSLGTSQSPRIARGPNRSLMYLVQPPRELAELSGWEALKSREYGHWQRVQKGHLSSGPCKVSLVRRRPTIDWWRSPGHWRRSSPDTSIPSVTASRTTCSRRRRGSSPGEIRRVRPTMNVSTSRYGLTACQSWTVTHWLLMRIFNVIIVEAACPSFHLEDRHNRHESCTPTVRRLQTDAQRPNYLSHWLRRHPLYPAVTLLKSTGVPKISRGSPEAKNHQSTGPTAIAPGVHISWIHLPCNDPCLT